MSIYQIPSKDLAEKIGRMLCKIKIPKSVGISSEYGNDSSGWTIYLNGIPLDFGEKMRDLVKGLLDEQEDETRDS